MSSAPDAAEIARDATWLPQAVDAQNGLVRLVRMDAETYRAASFLDDRMFGEPRDHLVVPWADVAGAVAGEARSDARWIFHIGHVGSTLVARLLGEIEGVLSIREPRSLRDVALLPAEQRGGFTDALRRLLSRTFGPEQIAAIKATSFVSEIAPELVGSGGRALFMFAAPRNYIASILAGENSLKELAALADFRAQRAAGRVSGLGGATAAHVAAAAWACEMTALESAAEQMGDRHLAWADFDRMLGDMPAELARVAAALEIVADEDTVTAIAGGPLMRRYSKALEYDYSPALRRELIAEAENAHRADIDSAVAMLQNVAEQSPMLARALQRSPPE